MSTSAAIPDRSRLVLALAALVISSAAYADPRSPVFRFGVAPARSQHFTVDAQNGGETRLTPLETAFTAFIDVTNVPESSLPSPILVVIHPDGPAFRQAFPGPGGGVRTTADRIETFDQPGLDNLLVRETARALFLGAIRGRCSGDLEWLRVGLTNAVVRRAAHDRADETRLREKAYFQKNGPADVQTVLSPGRAGGDRPSQVRAEVTASAITNYLLRFEGGLGVRSLLAGLGAGRTLDDAVSSAYPGRFRSMEELYGRWAKDELGIDVQPGLRGAPRAVQPARQTR